MSANDVTTENTRNADSLLSIKKFSEMSGIESSALRYWDSIGLFCPLQRGGGNDSRYYSPKQIITVNFIKVLRSLGIPLKVIAQAGKNRSPEKILQLINQQEYVLNKELHRLNDAHSTICVLRNTIQQGIAVLDPSEVTLQSMESMPITIGPRNRSEKDMLFYPSFLNYCNFAKDNHINLNTPIGGYWESMKQFLELPSLPTAFFSVDPLGSSERAAGEYLVGYNQGYYGDKGDSPQRIAAYADAHGIALKGPVYVLYLHGEICIEDPSMYLAQVCVGVAAVTSEVPETS